MTRVVPLVFVVALAVSWLPAQEPKPGPAPSRLTKQQLAQGWISLFDGETLFGWQPVGGSKWNVFKGILAPEGDKAATIATTMPFDNYVLAVEYQTRNDDVELLLNAEVEGDKLSAAAGPKLQPTGAGVGTVTATVRHGKVGQVYTMITDPLGIGGSASATASKAVDNAAGPQPGLIGIRGTGVVIRAVRLHPLDAKPLFNGRNLDGWKVFPGKKGEFAVGEGGTLTVKNGPGDLATEKEFSDFVLQLECRTNGKHLNSGIFFRALPGEYQKGYEAQIHNGWQDKAKTVEVDAFDPMTREPKGKEKIDTLAMDFGTGAIYRRIPARKQAAVDDEWFHMTVIAQGRRIATWVNGVQVVDWVDPRPEKDNPREGCRLGKGVISIQAHDPTTDLLFKNLRVADLAKKDAK